VQRDNGILRPSKAKNDGRVLPRELLDNGQGRCDNKKTTATDENSDMEISVEGTPKTVPQTQTIRGHSLLQPPIINTTGNIATGATTKTLQTRTKNSTTTSYGNNASTTNGQNMSGTQP
jgi:hypothetical protein